MSQKTLNDISCMALRGMTVFPGVIFHFDIGRLHSIKAIENAMSGDQTVFLVTQTDITENLPSENTLYKMGTYCKICQILKVPGDSIRVLVEGLSRARLDCLSSSDPFLKADITLIDDIPAQLLTKRDEAIMRRAKDMFLEFGDYGIQLPNDIFVNIADNEDIGRVSDFIAHYSPLKYDEKQILLSEISPRRRLEILTGMLAEELKVRSLEQELQDKVRENMDKNERDYFLREQMKVIGEELGDADDGPRESEEYAERIKALKLGADAEEKLLKEAKRLAKMQPSSPESAVIRGYLDVCIELPWNKYKEENSDITKAREILDADHFGLKKVKERILESFAVKNLTGGVKGQIICLVGPPGVGKTSVARSVARAMGRDFARISLGGVKDEADIRGHRRTYIGSMPGRIITAVNQAGSKNCLVLIDEIDKMGNDYKGDPSSALLEVLDTEQNSAFRDHFLELPFDLSDVLFITTANDADMIPAPLYDRMEVIELSGYTDEEKMHIAKDHLIPKMLKKHGLCAENTVISDGALRRIIISYTKESGVRGLERSIASLCRKAARTVEETGTKLVSYNEASLEKALGPEKFRRTDRGAQAESGVVCGLAWTSAGGDILEAEAMVLDGSGKLELTGNLGDVMKESAHAAITYLRSRRERFGLAQDFYTKHDIHIHFPEGAVPKDGPSAGITMATALISAFTGIAVPKSLAMTGEISIRGKVLPIGGLKEKTMAAFREGITTVILPEENRPDIQEIDPTVRKVLRFVYVSHMDDVAAFVFGDLAQATAEQDSKLSVIPPQDAPSGAHIRQ